VKHLDECLLSGVLSSSSFLVGTFVQLRLLLRSEGLSRLSGLLEGKLLLRNLSCSLGLFDPDVRLEKLSSPLSLSIWIQLDEETKISKRILSVDGVFRSLLWKTDGRLNFIRCNETMKVGAKKLGSWQNIMQFFSGRSSKSSIKSI